MAEEIQNPLGEKPLTGRRSLKNISIRKKTIAMILAVVVFSTATIVVVESVNNARRIRGSLVTHMEAMAAVAASNLAASLDFGNKKQGEKVLFSLSAVPEIVDAVVLDINHKEFISLKKNTPTGHGSLPEFSGGSVFRDDKLYVKARIVFNGEYNGDLFIIASTQLLMSQIYDRAIASLLLLAAVLIVSFFLGVWLSRSITGPVLTLAAAASTISSLGDYSIRVEKTGNDEIGALYDSFNDMLNQIEARNTEIRTLNEHLEDKVEERTHDLLKAKEQAEEARRRAESADQAKSAFLANMSHEIRTPMNAILGYSGLLLKIIEEPKQREFLEIVQNSGRNLLDLINDILDLSKIESGKMRLVLKVMNIHHMLTEIRNIFRIKTEEKGIDFHIDISPDFPAGLLMDETRLRQILFNVVGNAVKFTHEGHVSITASKKSSDLQTSRIDILFKIEDSGIGIPEEHQDTIFKAFEQQPGQGTQYGGAGLGLTITKRLVEMMNGSISVSSRPGKGSAFFIELRGVEISTMKKYNGESPKVSTEELFFKKNTVLLVEDNYYNLNLVKTIMEERNLNVITAENGKEALEKMNNAVPSLILMDIKMPVMNGYITTQLIRQNEQWKNIPVIALTADIMKESREKISASGCSGFLTKPVDEIQLLLMLMRFLPWEHLEETANSDDKNNAAISTAPASPELTPETMEKLSSLLDSQLIPRWETLGDSLLLDDWVEFGKRVKSAGELHNVPVLADYGEEIVSNVVRLNIIELKKSIRKFPALVNSFKKQMRSQA